MIILCISQICFSDFTFDFSFWCYYMPVSKAYRDFLHNISVIMTATGLNFYPGTWASAATIFFSLFWWLGLLYPELFCCNHSDSSAQTHLVSCLYHAKHKLLVFTLKTIRSHELCPFRRLSLSIIGSATVVVTTAVGWSPLLFFTCNSILLLQYLFSFNGHTWQIACNPFWGRVGKSVLNYYYIINNLHMKSLDPFQNQYPLKQ